MTVVGKSKSPEWGGAEAEVRSRAGEGTPSIQRRYELFNLVALQPSPSVADRLL